MRGLILKGSCAAQSLGVGGGGDGGGGAVKMRMGRSRSGEGPGLCIPNTLPGATSLPIWTPLEEKSVTGRLSPRRRCASVRSAACWKPVHR